jgi:hypothetical protein
MILIKISFIFLLFTFSLFPADIEIPGQSDWTDRGAVLTCGTGWDGYFAGITPSTVVKLNGTYFLYYIGASGPRSTDQGPANRALGVATSTDGINFTRYAGNPVITHQPHSNIEEGIISAKAVCVNDTIYMYWGAIWASNRTTESVDVFTRLSVSTDGFNFTDKGEIYRGSENGNENWPFSVLNVQGRAGGTSGSWFVWYGKQQPGHILVGNSPYSMSSIGTSNLSNSINYRGADKVFLGGQRVAVFRNMPVRVDTANINDLKSWQGPVHTYNVGSDAGLPTVYIDRETGTWFQYFMENVSKGLSSGTTPAESKQRRIRCWTAAIPGSTRGEKQESRKTEIGLTIFPNPLNRNTNIRFNKGNGINLKIYDMAGRVVADFSSQLSIGRAFWDAGNTGAGTYILQAQTGTDNISTRMVVY